MDFLALAQQCAPAVHPQTIAAVVRVESGFNPYAIGVVGGRLERQPANKAEAVATAKALEQAGYNFSLGVGQVNRYNLPKYGLDYEQAFDACQSLRVGSLILKECFDRARGRIKGEQEALHAALSCYYSGNFSTGFRADFAGQPSYVQKVLNAAGATGVNPTAPIRVIRTAASTTQKRATAEQAPVRLAAESQAPPGNVYGSEPDSVMVFR
jgi:type IV secretion system protein VirB1